MKSVILSFYLGTQSMRGALVNAVGEILHFARDEFEQPFFSKYPGWAEQKAEFYWEALCKVSKELKEKSGKDWGNIQGITLSTMRDTTVCVDEEGRPLRPAILWMDKRRVEIPKSLPILNKMIFKIANISDVTENINRMAACNWIMENEPEIWNRTYKYLMLSGYLYHKLVGKFVDSSANIVGHVPFNYRKNRWLKSKELSYCLFPVPHEKLCYLCEPEEIAGTVIKEAEKETGIPAGLPLIATGSDKSCEAIGLSCITPEKAAVSLGTTATVQYMTSKYIEPQACMPPYPSPYRGRYSLEIELYRGYWLVSWFKKEFADVEVQQGMSMGVRPEDILNKKLPDVPPGCNGLVFQPYFTPVAIMPNARGAMVGLSDTHTRLHMYRAIIEGINFALLDGMETLQNRLDVKTEAVYVSGGASRSDEICQILADMTGLHVYRIHTHEAGIIGSSLVGFKGLGIFQTIEEGVQNMVHIQKPFRPNVKTHDIYLKLYKNVFLHLFDRLSPLYDKVGLLDS